MIYKRIDFRILDSQLTLLDKIGIPPFLVEARAGSEWWGGDPRVAKIGALAREYAGDITKAFQFTPGGRMGGGQILGTLLHRLGLNPYGIPRRYQNKIVRFYRLGIPDCKKLKDPLVDSLTDLLVVLD